MSDIVERLRDARNWLNGGKCCGDKDSDGVCAAPACIFGEALKELYEAADEIEHLRARNERLVELLEKCSTLLHRSVYRIDNAVRRSVTDDELLRDIDTALFYVNSALPRKETGDGSS